MSATQFIAEAQSYIDDQQSQLSSYLSSLNSLSTGRDGALDLIKTKLLQSVQNIASSWTQYADTSSLFENYIAGYVNGALDGTTASEAVLQQNRRILSSLGAIFAAEPEAPAYMAKKTADEISTLLEDREEILGRISAGLVKLKSEVSAIDTEWYSDYLTDTSNAKNDLDNAISNVLTVRGNLYNQGAINDGEMDIARGKVLSSLDHLTKADSAASIVDMMYYSQQLVSDIASLEALDIATVEYIDNIKQFKTSFNENAQGSRRFFDYVREMTEAQYTEMLSVSKSMTAVLRKNSAAIATAKSSEWIKKLTTIAAALENTVSDYGFSLNDSSNVNSILLDDFIDNINLPNRSIDSNVSSRTRSTTGLISRIINIEADKPEVITAIDSSITDISNQTENTRRVIMDCNDYEPTTVESINEFLRFLNNLNLDRARSILLSSNWGLIFRLDEANLTFSGFMSTLVGSFINDIQDQELKNMVLGLYYKIRGQQRAKQIMALTFDSLKRKAVNNIVDVRLKEISQMEAQLSVLIGQL